MLKQVGEGATDVIVLTLPKAVETLPTLKISMFRQAAQR